MSTNLEQSSTAVHHAPPRVRAVTAWELIAITLRYYRKLILLGYGVISVVGALILAIVVLVEGREIRVVFLLATALFVCGSMLLEDVSPRLMIELGHQGISQHHPDSLRSELPSCPNWPAYQPPFGGGPCI